VETDGQTHVLQESDVLAAGDLRIRVAEISLRRIVLREEAGPGEAVLEVPR
jgi:hypothetical protein